MGDVYLLDEARATTLAEMVLISSSARSKLSTGSIMTAWLVFGQATMYCHVPVCLSTMGCTIGSMIMRMSRFWILTCWRRSGQGKPDARLLGKKMKVAHTGHVSKGNISSCRVFNKTLYGNQDIVRLAFLGRGLSINISIGVYI
jgi:hypothetical protein